MLMMKICASIAEIDPKELRKSAVRALDKGASFLEIRFDYISPNRFAEALIAVRPFRASSIYTLRKARQGGKFEGSEIQRLRYLKQMSDQKPMMIDVEYDTLHKSPKIGSFIKSLNIPILLSWHDFKTTPSFKKLSEMLGSMSSYSNNIKLVTMANSFEDTLRVLKLYETVDKTVNLVAFSMGEIGLISRVLCALQSNCPFTYASVGRQVAPGQLTIEQMQKLHSMIITGSSHAGG